MIDDLARRELLAGLSLAPFLPFPFEDADMQIRAINPTDAAYSQAVEISNVRRFVFVSGQVPVDEKDRVPATFREQARLAWANVAAQLREAQMTVRNIVKMTIFLSDRKYRGETYEVRREVLGEHCPAMSIIICGIYREEWLLEIEAIAAA